MMLLYRVIEKDRREVSFLGGGSICHCEKEFHTNMCLIVIGYRGGAVSVYKCKAL